ncbi:MAG: phosphoglucosamine mutase [Proteobacteria bacterium]|nr:phosphoglucosamine mutase [Pseudomonadota bacterium]MDA1300322.1 phosphoglucosamine mutase [Pseudomonadota bacterium]
MQKRFFGTDGIRGRVGEHPITPEFVLKLGWAAGKVFTRTGRGRLLIGKDTRVSGYMFESALEAGLAAAGADVALLGPMPTPAIAYLTRTFKANAGIVISASHNPYYDNGIKFFSQDGEKIDDEVERAIERELDQPMTMVGSDQIGKVSRISDAAGRYIEFCKSCFPSQYDLKGLKVVLDCANGATYHIAPNVFRELGADVVEIGTEPDGFNINADSGSTSTQALQQAVVASRADFGVALDGDGDRVIMVDGCGEVVDGDELLLIIAHARNSTRRLEGGVVGTQMSNLGLEKALERQSIPFVRAAVGDRHVLAELTRRGWKLGGESSGHILCLDLTSTGDGIISALQVVAGIIGSGESLHELKGGMDKYPQFMVNVRCGRRVVLADMPEIDRAVAAIEKELSGHGRVLLRPSGTEPVVRVMVEGDNPELVERLANDLAEVVAESVG